MKSKQLNKGISQLMDEGVAQLFTSEFNGRKIIGTVGQLQFEVIEYRLEHEYGAKCTWEPLAIHKACWVSSESEEEFKDFKLRKERFIAKDKFGQYVFLADSRYSISQAEQKYEHLTFHTTSEFK
jgi:peptide chain release factor 3